jgi:hypothetical protein
MVEIDPGDLEKILPVKKVNVAVRASAV